VAHVTAHLKANNIHPKLSGSRSTWTPQTNWVTDIDRNFPNFVTQLSTNE